MAEAATERLQLEKVDIDIARTLTPIDVAVMQHADIVIPDVGGQIYYLSSTRRMRLQERQVPLRAHAVDYQGRPTPSEGAAVVNRLPALGLWGALDDNPYSWISRTPKR